MCTFGHLVITLPMHPGLVCTRRSAGRTPWALADALMPIFGKTTSKPELAKKGSIDARMKAQVSAREAEAARKAREATADAMQEAAAAVVMQRATRTRSAAETKAKKDLEDQQAAPHSVCTPPALHALHRCCSSARHPHSFGALPAPLAAARAAR